MKKLIIISNGTLPVPAVNGGAVEVLTESFIDQNEYRPMFDIVVFSISDIKIKPLSKKYKYTKFIFINPMSHFFKLGKLIRFVINRYLYKQVPNQFLSTVLKHHLLFDSADIIMVENNPSFIPFIKPFSNVPVGLHLHNDYLNENNQEYSSYILSKSDFIFGVSDYVFRRVRDVSQGNCVCDYIHNGIDLTRFNQRTKISNKKLLAIKKSCNKNDLVIIYSGRLQESKGIKLLLTVFLKLSEIYKLKLIIVGSSAFGGSKKTKFIRELEDLVGRKKEDIIFTGFVNYTEIHQVYNLGNFSVIPSLAEEAFGLTVAESLACGLPVISTNAGGIPEILTPECGIILTRDSNLEENLYIAMKKLIVDENLRSSMSAKALERAKYFSVESYFSKLSFKLNQIIS